MFLWVRSHKWALLLSLNWRIEQKTSYPQSDAMSWSVVSIISDEGENVQCQAGVTSLWDREERFTSFIFHRKRFGRSFFFFSCKTTAEGMKGEGQLFSLSLSWVLRRKWNWHVPEKCNSSFVSAWAFLIWWASFLHFFRLLRISFSGSFSAPLRNWE